ncbi:phosphoethanolamine transferase EptA [Jejubacter calystegiae]|uniref:Phosphoethanolamine transferase EptA n=1 Tax=Jejubacter calystegiae TaxID=2579935 RepID=A0A4V1G7X1_9ENTR|nr:phosphoethanolamine transferase EptA [Jejubacter calystegiae]QCT21127.1 phosphoethanolamine transferase EptA [Jejubacter calystegiae]
MLLKNKLQCNDSLFNLLCATLFTLINALFIRRSWQAIAPHSSREFLFAASVPLVLFCAWLAIFSLITLPLLRKPLLAVLIVGCAVANYFTYSYGAVIDTNMMRNVFETDIQESMALITPQLLLWLALAGLLPAALICTLHVSRAARWWYPLCTRLLTVLLSLLVILLVAALFYKDYASLFRNTKGIAKLVTPPNYISALTNYGKERWFNGDRRLIRIGEDAGRGATLAKERKKTVLIVVLGEASRAQNYSLGGYHRETNPELKKQNVIWFDNATSCGTETAVSVPCMFSGMTRAGYDASTARHREGLMDVLAHAGINVLWRDNDGGCKGACDRIPQTNMTLWNLPEWCSKGSCLDDALLYRLDNILDGVQRDTTIVLHLMGSHGPAWYRRYPSRFRRFTPTCDSNQIQECSRQSLINTYDNTILYTDDVVSRVIDTLKARQSQLNGAMIYLSDHGESLGEEGLYLHGTPRMLAPDEQVRIPFLFWLSEDYARQTGTDTRCLRQSARSTAISQDNLFDTVLGMMDVRTRIYRPGLDLLNGCRSVPERLARG